MRKINDDPVIPIGKSSGVKLTLIEFYRKIGHKSVMSIREFFIDRDEPAHLVDLPYVLGVAIIKRSSFLSKK